MPAPVKSEMLERLPNNYESAVKRTMTLKHSALQNPKCKQILTGTFAKLVGEKWIIPVDS